MLIPARNDIETISICEK